MGATSPRGDETECKDSKERGRVRRRSQRLLVHFIPAKSPWSGLSLKVTCLFP